MSLQRIPIAPQTLRRHALDAVQRAVTLVVVLGVIGLIAWLAGIAELGDLPWVLAGAFGGSLTVALFKRDTRTAYRN